MSRPQPRSVYVRRRLLVLAGLLLVAWAVVQFWPFGSKNDPVTTTTVTAPAPPTGQPTTMPSVMPSATPVAAHVSVKLTGGGKTCDTKLVTLTPAVPSPQHARSSVAIDIAVTTSSKKPCVLKPKGYDPLAIMEQDGKTVWDSSICKKPLLSDPIQLTPGWASVVRATWVPRKSGEACADDENWAHSGEYTLRLGMLGGEPGKAQFMLSKPLPKPKPSPSATSTAKPKPKPSASASPEPSKSEPSAKPPAKKDNR